MSPPDAPFYVGYLPTPPGLARFLRVVVAGLLLGAALVSLGAVLGQQPFAAARYDFGQPRTWEGTLVTTPQPMLLVQRPGDAAGQSAFYLVNPGKWGATLGGAAAGERVRVEGSLIYRGDQTMLEILPETLVSLGPASGAATHPEVELLGEQTLRGEIVDSKCFLGVMNPGNLKPHRACATRCISGGIPPILLVREAGGGVRHLLLVGPAGESIGAQVLDRIAEPVEVTGQVERHWDRLVLKVDPARIRRIEQTED